MWQNLVNTKQGYGSNFDNLLIYFCFWKWVSLVITDHMQVLHVRVVHVSTSWGWGIQVFHNNACFRRNHYFPPFVLMFGLVFYNCTRNKKTFLFVTQTQRARVVMKNLLLIYARTSLCLFNLVCVTQFNLYINLCI